MLPSQKRIPRQVFSNQKNTQRIRGDGFAIVVYRHQNDDSPTPRVSVTVSKKISSSAVARNRVKRRYYAALRAVYSLLKPNMDYQVIIGPTGKDALPQEIIKKLQHIFQ